MSPSKPLFPAAPPPRHPLLPPVVVSSAALLPLLVICALRPTSLPLSTTSSARPSGPGPRPRFTTTTTGYRYRCPCSRPLSSSLPCLLLSPQWRRSSNTCSRPSLAKDKISCPTLVRPLCLGLPPTTASGIGLPTTASMRRSSSLTLHPRFGSVSSSTYFVFAPIPANSHLGFWV